MKLVVITPETTAPVETEMVNRLFEQGLERLHLRKKDFGIAAYHAYLQEVDPQYHNRISIHEQYDLILTYPALGIHCKNHALHDKTQMNHLVELHAPRLSASVHSWREVEENAYRLDYVFISPVFSSISKKGYTASPQLLRDFPENRSGSSEIIGLGGITDSNISILHEIGFNGAAVLGFVWEATDPLAAFSLLQNKVNAMR